MFFKVIIFRVNKRRCGINTDDSHKAGFPSFMLGEKPQTQ